MPCAIFSKVTQFDELDILAALTSLLLPTIKKMENSNSLPLSQWPVYFATLKKLSNENGRKKGVSMPGTEEVWWSAELLQRTLWGVYH